MDAKTSKEKYDDEKQDVFSLLESPHKTLINYKEKMYLYGEEEIQQTHLTQVIKGDITSNGISLNCAFQHGAQRRNNIISVVFLPKTYNLNLVKTSEKPKSRKFYKNSWLELFKIAKIVKYSKLKEAKET